MDRIVGHLRCTLDAVMQELSVRGIPAKFYDALFFAQKDGEMFKRLIVAFISREEFLLNLTAEHCSNKS